MDSIVTRAQGVDCPALRGSAIGAGACGSVKLCGTRALPNPRGDHSFALALQVGVRGDHRPEGGKHHPGPGVQLFNRLRPGQVGQDGERRTVAGSIPLAAKSTSSISWIIASKDVSAVQPSTV
jgi:hypothetical protein